ncbi:MAG: Ig-like domain-containing protein, partial [Thiothrix sp.]
MDRPSVITHSATALLCSVALLSGCGGGASSATVAAAHDSNANSTMSAPNANTSPAPVQPISVAGKAYVGEQGMVIIYADGNAMAYSSTATSSAAAKSTALTWTLDGTTLTLAAAGGTQTFTVAADGTTLTAGDVVYRQGKALDFAQWRETDLGVVILGQNYYATWRFTPTQLLIAEKSGSGFYREIPLEVTPVTGVDNLWHVTGTAINQTVPASSSPVDAYVLLLDGTPTGGSQWRWVSATPNAALSALDRPVLTFPAVAPPSSGSNTPPTATPDPASTTAGTPVSIAVLANDTDADGDPLSITGYS